MPYFNKSKGFKLKSGNAPKFKMVGSSSPLHKDLNSAGFEGIDITENTLERGSTDKENWF